MGNLISTTDPLGQSTSRAYDALARLLSVTDPLGQTTQFGYDVMSRMTQIADALGGLTQFSYDGNGNLTDVTDAKGHTVQHVYDAMDRLASRIDPFGQTEDYAYDANGNLTAFTDRKGQVGTFSYDALNRRTGASYADGSTTTYTYDAGSRLTQASDSVGGTISNQFDLLDRPIQQTTGLGTMSYQYDASGRRTSMTAPGQAAVTYAYDAASRLAQVAQGSQAVDLQYDASGRRTQLTLPNGVSTDYAYDAASRITELIYRNAGGPIGNLTYQYDAASSRTQMAGSLARTLTPNPVPNATYDAANRQLTFGDKTMSYDANGNLTAITDPAGTTTYTWDARNRLVGLSGPGTSASFSYDAFGRRISKQINGSTTQYPYDGLDIIQERLDGVPVSFLRSVAIDEPFIRNGTEYYLSAALGSILGLTDATGTLTTRYVYDPFGGTSTEGAPSSNPFQYTGRENDGTGLYYYRSRYYDPARQRFISEDPILAPLTGSAPSLLGACQIAGGRAWLLPLLIQSQPRQATQLSNSYVYVSNDPLNKRDPRGLLTEGEARCLGICRGAYVVVCDIICAEGGPLWFPCNVACFTASEIGCGIACTPPPEPPIRRPPPPPPPPPGPPPPPPCSGRKC